MNESHGEAIQPVAARAPDELAQCENRFFTMRKAPAELGAAFAEAFATAAGTESASPDLQAIRRTGEALVAATLADPGPARTLPYHNPHHFAEATLAMGWLCASARALGLISARDAVLSVVAMVGHDIGHDGVTITGGILESRAAADTARIARDAGMDDRECARLSDIILGTDPAEVAANAARSSGRRPPGPFGVTGDWLRSLANEADVMASLMPVLGLHLGTALAEERRLAGDPNADRVASFSLHLEFLRCYAWFTPAAAAIGLADLVRRKIQAFSSVAQRLGAAVTPEAGAAALDRMDRAEALTLYRSAFDRVDEPPRRDPIGAPPTHRRFRIGLTVTILTAFTVVFVTVMGFTAAATYRQTMRTAIASAERSMADLTSRTAARTAALVEPLYAAVTIAPLLLNDTSAFNEPDGDTEETFRGLLGVLPQAAAISLADTDGSLLRVFNWDVMTPARRQSLAAPPETHYVARLSNGSGEDIMRFLGPSGQLLEQRRQPRSGDPQDEVWFHTARHAEGVATTVLHMFSDLGVPGLSIVHGLPDGRAIGMDIVLDSLSAFLHDQRVSPHSLAFIIDDNGILIAHSDLFVAMSQVGSDDTPNWITIASSPDPILRAFWLRFSTGKQPPGDTTEMEIGGQSYLARILQLDGVGSPPMLIAVVAPMTDFTAPILRARNWTLALSLVAGVVGLVLIWFVARLITRPLAALTREAEAIRRFELDVPLPVASHITEVAHLATTMHAMKAALHSFGLYVPKYLVREIVQGAGAARVGGERRIVTIMFTDIVGFTTIADGMDAERLTRLTSEYFEGMTRTLMDAGGTIDKYIGDGIMVLWNAPAPYPNHASGACLAALRCRLLSERMERGFAERGWPGLLTRFGVNTGEAVVGNVGSSDRLSYTAIGATVNMAARMEGLNRQYGTQVLVSDATRAAAGPAFVFRRVDRVLAKGRQQPTELHELLGLRHADDPADADLVLAPAEIAWAQAWDGIVSNYLRRQFADAQAALAALPPLRNDPLHDMFFKRIDTFTARPPPEDWDGVTAYNEK
jgi:adenylate cyclase